ncbi:MAG: hypothetical protein EA401_10380 [Planctomycetota bacterium]|nr:MAG: hypothetical protein EA401_10380 [Planctomycetota bacterium]
MSEQRRPHGLPVLRGSEAVKDRERVRSYLALKLAACGCPVPPSGGEIDGMLDIAQDLLHSYQEAGRLLSHSLCPVDQRIQDFLDRHVVQPDAQVPLRLPALNLLLDQHGLARELSLPCDADSYKNALISSFRCANGVMHNPVNDRRTTQGVFHVAEGGLPIPGDKKAVPLATFARLLQVALQPPQDLLELPYTSNQEQKAATWVSLLLRPEVCPAAPGYSDAKRLELRFFAPGSMVANLDFVESVFGNAGDPLLPENDAALDPETWTGHSGCVILAPHLVRVSKKAMGLPHISEATERQKSDGMCWEKPDELYNDGGAFKVTCRNEEGVIITVIADNYFGYCKKEVKTQISYSANLFGLAEEEHAGGALAFASYGLGNHYYPDSRVSDGSYSLAEALTLLGDRAKVQAQGHAVDQRYPQVVYIPEDAQMDVEALRVWWMRGGARQEIPLLAGHHYVHPSGFRVELRKHEGASSWRLVGTDARGIMCHKPCTVSGGGKSEISKSISDAIIYGPFYVQDLKDDLTRLREIIARDFSDRFLPEHPPNRPSRPLLSEDRSLGSVIKMLTPSEDEFTSEYNQWLESIPNYLRALVFAVKRFYRPEWGDDWESHFSVDTVNGHPGHEFKFDGRKLVASYLRVGHTQEGAWRTFKLRQDFMPAAKVQTEDDITASVVLPPSAVGIDEEGHPSVKLITNCETRLFQRPDDAIIRGYDQQTESDMADEGNFFSNWEPLSCEEVDDLIQNAVAFEEFTKPMRKRMLRSQRKRSTWTVSSAHPRMVNGKPSKNPRYLQIRPDVVDPLGRHLADVSGRLQRRVPVDKPVMYHVGAVLPGRRNNPPEPGVRPLAVYNPIHYQELPELFMDFVCSLTGKSPSTTGAGSEGALTKGPFNALRPAADVNNALVSMILCDHHAFSTAAGWVGPHYRVDHDVSLLVPEIWCRLSTKERDPQWLISHGYLEKIDDFEHQGQTVLASRLGYRITRRFANHFLGRIFDNPMAVFDDGMLQPELQGMDVYVDGISNIVEAQQLVAQRWLEDGSADAACPPLRILLHIMAEGTWQGKAIDDPAVRAHFTRDYLLSSDWYQERLQIKQRRDIARWQRSVQTLKAFLERSSHSEEASRLGIQGRLAQAEAKLKRLQTPVYLQSLVGTIGADPLGQSSLEH